MTNITTPEFNILAARVFNARLAQGNLVTKTDFDTKLQVLNKKINSNKIKQLLVKNQFKKLNNFDAAYFGDDATQNYLVFQSMHKYFEWLNGDDSEISSWE